MQWGRGGESSPIDRALTLDDSGEDAVAAPFGAAGAAGKQLSHVPTLPLYHSRTKQGLETDPTLDSCQIKLDWWTVRDSNPRPQRCERRALPAELTAHRRADDYKRICARLQMRLNQEVTPPWSGEILSGTRAEARVYPLSERHDGMERGRRFW